jgi:hypothetical protein
MFTSGKLNADVVKNFFEHTYYLPIKNEVNLRSIDPDRVNPLSEYPRWTGKPSLPIHNKQGLIDYRIMTKGNVFEVWLLANEFTPAKYCKKIFECYVNHLLDSKTMEFLLKKAINQAF